MCRDRTSSRSSPRAIRASTSRCSSRVRRRDPMSSRRYWPGGTRCRRAPSPAPRTRSPKRSCAVWCVLSPKGPPSTSVITRPRALPRRTGGCGPTRSCTPARAGTFAPMTASAPASSTSCSSAWSRHDPARRLGLSRQIRTPAGRSSSRCRWSPTPCSMSTRLHSWPVTSA